MDFSNRAQAYYKLTKPGIIYGNIMTAVAGFFLAARTHPRVGLLVATLAGIALVIGASSVANNYIDRNLDKKMSRTKNRAMAAGTISSRSALIYGIILGVVGFAILAVYTNWLTVGIGVIATLDYVVLYGITKRRFPAGTLVGSISGAAPPVAGYTAVTGHLDVAALLLFVILVCWQMPHFYAIATYRLKDYKATGLPVLPAKKGVAVTKRYILGYVIAFIVVAMLLYVFGYVGWIYAVLMAILGAIWLGKAIKGFHAPNPAKWARGMFLFSLIVITVLCIMIPVGAIWR